MRLPTHQGSLENRDYRRDSIQNPPSNKGPISIKPPPPPFECVFVNECPHSAKRSYSNIILGYGYVSTEVQLPLIAHKRAVMPHYKNSGLLSM